MNYTKTQFWLAIITILLCGLTSIYFMLGLIISREELIKIRVEYKLAAMKYSCANEIKKLIINN